MLKATYKKHNLIFKKQAGTSRGVLLEKPSWYLILEQNGKRGVGECSVLPKLSLEKNTDLSPVFEEICVEIHLGEEYLKQKWKHFPAVHFAIEMAFLDLYFGKEKEFFANNFFERKEGIVTNGLIWMSDKADMLKQIEDKIQQGFKCVKLKIGAINWQDELDLLRHIRQSYSSNKIELRVDANGAFSPESALEKLEALAKFDIHSIEQPIGAGQGKAMANLCKHTPLPIALDEELIGIQKTEEREILLSTINPQYIILKPSLVGGFADAEEWVSLAEKNKIGWWATSALEGNIGLNAIAQWTSKMKVNMPQGLGTGALFTNNIESPLTIKGEKLIYTSVDWQNISI